MAVASSEEKSSAATWKESAYYLVLGGLTEQSCRRHWQNKSSTGTLCCTQFVLRSSLPGNLGLQNPPLRERLQLGAFLPALLSVFGLQLAPCFIVSPFFLGGGRGKWREGGRTGKHRLLSVPCGFLWLLLNAQVISIQTRKTFF